MLETYRYERLSTVVRRDVAGWRGQLHQAPPRSRGLAPATVNLHLAHLRGFLTWVRAHDLDALPHGNPTEGVKDLPLPALEPRALDERQVRSRPTSVWPSGLRHFALGLCAFEATQEANPTSASITSCGPVGSRPCAH
jgi:hypothetical protein